METVKKTLGVIFALLFIGTAVPAMIFFNFDRKAFNAETYQRAFAREDFYGKLPASLAQAMVSPNTDQSRFPIVISGLSQEAWEAFFRSLLPQEALKSMGDDILNSTAAYVNMKTDSVQFSLTPLKSSIVSDAAVQAVFTLLKTQPDCSLMQIGQMTIGLLTKADIQFCNPPQEMIPLLTPVVQAQMQVTASVIPDSLTLLSAPPENDPRERLQVSRWAMRLSPILPLGFLLLMTVSVVNSLKSWLTWWGIPFFITGGLASLTSLAGAPIFGAVFERMLVKRMPAFLPAILLDYTSDLAATMLRALLRPVLWEGLVLALIGIMMIAISFFVRRKAKPKLEHPSEAKTMI